MTESKQPSEAEILEKIGDKYTKYEAFRQEAESSSWKFSADWKNSKQSGWFQTADINGKRMYYFFPKGGGFIFRIVFNDKAIEAIKKGHFPGFIIEELEKTKKYHEGKPFDLNEESFEPGLVKDLIKIKLDSMT